MDHYIYAVGGYDSHSQLRTVERYNVEQNVWEFMPSMLHPRSALSATVFDGKIWVFGESLFPFSSSLLGEFTAWTPL